MIYDLAMITIGILLTAGTALFVAAEFSFVALDPATVDAKAQEGDPHASRVAPNLHHISLYLSACQVGITLTTICSDMWLKHPCKISLCACCTIQRLRKAPW